VGLEERALCELPEALIRLIVLPQDTVTLRMRWFSKSAPAVPPRLHSWFNARAGPERVRVSNGASHARTDPLGLEVFGIAHRACS
jgi:hypothetical protein